MGLFASTKSGLPKIAITMGDPTGVGPEIIAGALQHPDIYQICQPVFIGRPDILHRACRLLNLSSEVVEVTEDPNQQGSQNKILCLTEGNSEADSAPHGRIDARGGQAAFDCLVAATKLAINQQVDAIVTAPLHKAALHAAGHYWPGHTELLAHLCGIENFAMMLYLPPEFTPTSEASIATHLSSGQRGADPKSDSPNCDTQEHEHSFEKFPNTNSRRGGQVGLGVVHVTLHMALRDIFQHITTESIFEKITLAHETFSRLRTAMDLSPTPAIAVAALNPHAGEEGLFGEEEATIIRPAVELARARGWNVKGPLPVDTLMPRAADGDYDVVVAMYHDQGHIALKLLDMFDAVNITLGLPILRTSVAHGTAHDQAWKGTASCSGMIQAIRTAAWLARKPSVDQAIVSSLSQPIACSTR